MDLQFIQAEHRQGVSSIIEICGLGIREALQLYRKHGNNIENAINAHLNPLSPLRATRDIQGIPFMSAQSAFSDDDKQYGQAYQKYKNFVQKGVSFLKKYSLNGIGKRDSSLQSQKNTKSNKSLLIKQLEKRFGCPSSLRINDTKIDEALIWSWKQKYPIGLFLFDEQKESYQKFKQLFSNRNFSKNCSDFFYLIALEIGKQKVRPWLTKFFNTDLDANKLVILRINFIDDIQVVAKIPFQQGMEQFERQMNRVKSQCIHRQLDETQLVKQHALNRQGIKFRPQFFRERMIKRQDARLRRAQNQAFFKAALPIQKKEKDTQVLKKKIPSEDQILKYRKQKRQGLVKYCDGLILKLRLPSGKSFQLSVGENEQINYLFDYIDSIEGEIGFEKDYPRVFDIIWGPSNINSLLGRKQAKISEILQPFEVLIVKEISDE